MANISQMQGSGLSTAGEISIKAINISDSAGNRTYSIFPTFLELDIYEDLYAPCLTGTVTIVEASNLISTVPIIGEELLNVEFVTPGLGESAIVKKTFYITKVEDRTIKGDKANAYVLHFISVEGLNDLSTKLSQAYEGNAADIIKQIFTEELMEDDPIEIESADNHIKFVAPFWSPFQCINYAATRCIKQNSTINIPNYLFYQTLHGFKLKSLSSLFNQQPWITYYFDKSPARMHRVGGSTRDIVREYQTIIRLDFIKSQDYIDQTLRGAFTHTVFGVNMLRKQIAKRSYNYINDFGKTPHLDKYPLNSNNLIVDSKNHGLIDTRLVAPQLFNGVGDKADDIIAKRIALINQVEIFKLDVVAWGMSDIEVGNVVYFKMNEYKEVDQDEIQEPNYDRYYSGKYLITAIQHRITQSRHQMTMQIVKDSMLNQIDFNRAG